MSWSGRKPSERICRLCACEIVSIDVVIPARHLLAHLHRDQPAVRGKIECVRPLFKGRAVSVAVALGSNPIVGYIRQLIDPSSIVIEVVSALNDAAVRCQSCSELSLRPITRILTLAGNDYPFGGQFWFLWPGKLALRAGALAKE